jgi:hypothetical protein
MSQRDLVAELRAARVAAPPEVRDRIRLIARSATPPRRVFTWRRALVVALPAAAAIVAAVVFTRPASHSQQPVALEAQSAVARGALAPKQAIPFAAPTTDQARVQRYNATLSLRLKNVSDAVKRVQAITRSLGGYPVTIVAGSQGRSASADLVVKVPRTHVQEALRRFSALGTITAENVQLQDLEAGLNATDRLIARLQRRLAELRTQPQTDATRRLIAEHVSRIQRLQRQEAATRRAARFATVSLHLSTPSAVKGAAHRHGPWHALGVTFRWLGIGAVYALALGVPFLLLVALVWSAVRIVRRRRVDALLSRP